MATLSGMVRDLKLRASVEASEGFSDPLDFISVLTAASSLHNPDYVLSETQCTIPAKEVYPVVLLAWSELCLIRASKVADDPSVSQGGYGTDRNTPYYKLTDLSEKIVSKYREVCSALQLSTYFGIGGTPIVTEVTCENMDLGAQTPVEMSIVPPAISITTSPTASVNPDGTVLITWVQALYGNYSSVAILISESASEAIYQAWNMDSTTGIPRTSNLATLVTKITDPTQKVGKLTGLPTTGTVRFLLVGISKSGKCAYSNEVVFSM